jgi:hypothetical protein
VVSDKHGKVVRTYTTDTTTLGSTALKVFTPQPGSQAEHDLKTTGTLRPLPTRTRPTP